MPYSVVRFASNALRVFPKIHCNVRCGYYQLRGIRQAHAWAQLQRFCVDSSRLEFAPFFVKVGANHGLTGDPVADLILNENSWKGLLIEPVPYCFDRLQLNYSGRKRFVCEQIAIDLVPSRLPFTTLTKE